MKPLLLTKGTFSDKATSSSEFVALFIVELCLAEGIEFAYN